MINVAVMEGWAGGPRLSGQFRDALRAAGYGITDPAHADVIIAHSVACYFAPVKTPAKLLILIDPPYSPGKHIINRIIANKSNGIQVNGWKAKLSRAFWELTYIFAKPSYTSTAISKNGSLDFLSSHSDKSIYLVRNETDYLCSADIQVAVNGHPNIRYVTLPGGHSDYYANPQPYIALLPKDL